MKLEAGDPVWFRLLSPPPLAVVFPLVTWSIEFSPADGAGGQRHQLIARGSSGKIYEISFHFNDRQALEEDVVTCFAVRHLMHGESIMMALVKERKAVAVAEPVPLPAFERGGVSNPDWERRRREHLAPSGSAVPRPPAACTTFRLLDPLPVAVNGGKTRWVIFRHYYGKNHARCELLARCVETNDHLKIYDGKGPGGHEHESGVAIERGTLLYRIFMKLFHERRAAIVPEGKTVLEEYLFPLPPAVKPITIQRPRK